MASKTAKKIVAFKGFDKDLKCRDFQFEIGKSYKAKGKVEICANGFHACESPFDVWSYYGPVESRFAIVELSGDTATHSEDTKIAAAEINIKAELTLPEFIRRGVDWLIEATKGRSPKDTSGYSAQIGSSGDYAQIGSSGDYAQIGSSGDYAQIGSSGYSAQIGSSGYSAQIGSSGDYARIGSSGDYARIGSSGYSAQIGSSGYSAQIGSSGDYARIGSSGYSAQIGSSGYSAQIGSSGDYARIGSSGYSAQIGSSGYSAQIGSSGYSARIETTGENAVVASAGIAAKAKGAKDTWISLAEFDDERKCVGFATGCIGKGGLKPDTWYEAKNGELTEVK